MTTMTPEQMQAEIARLNAENADLKATPAPNAPEVVYWAPKEGKRGTSQMGLKISSPGGFTTRIKLGNATASRDLDASEKAYLIATGEALVKLGS